jgi:mRNA-degrading endonuclease HigB of HigAB toxin-antitoxin module
MKVVGTGLISAYTATGGGSATADLQNWLSATRAAGWLGPSDLRATFPAATHAGGHHWNFPMPRSNAQVTAIVNFRNGTVLVTRVI